MDKYRKELHESKEWRVYDVSDDGKRLLGRFDKEDDATRYIASREYTERIKDKIDGRKN